MFEDVLKTKKILIALLSLFLAVLAVFFAVKVINEIKSGEYIGKDLPSVNTVTVSGKGEVFVRPDIAKISVSVEKEAVSVLEAQSQATEVINKITAFLKESGVEDKDIKTTNYNIYPRYDYLEKTGRVFRGYIVDQTLEIKIRKIDEAGKILAGITQAGANQIGGISFAIDDEEAAKRDARQKAIVDAKTKAEQLAKDLGIKFGHLISFSENGGGYPYPVYKSEALGMGGAEPAPAVPAGENTVTVNVSLTYEIK
jgi:uncharacterized protein YggE